MNWKDFLSHERANQNVVAFKTIYADMGGDVLAGLALSQIVYWHLPSKNGDSKLKVKKENHFWLVKSHKDFYKETRLNRTQILRALKILKKKELIAIKLFKFNGSPTNHIRILGDNFIKSYEASLNLDCSNMNNPMFKYEQSVCSNLNNPMFIFEQSLTETTSKTTQILQKEEKTVFSKPTLSIENKNNLNGKIVNPELFSEISKIFNIEVGHPIKQTKKFLGKWNKIVLELDDREIKNGARAFLASKWHIENPTARTASVFFNDANKILDFSVAWDIKIKAIEEKRQDELKSKAEEKVRNEKDKKELQIRIINAEKWMEENKSKLPANLSQWIEKIKIHFVGIGARMYFNVPKNCPVNKMEAAFTELGQKVRISSPET